MYGDCGVGLCWWTVAARWCFVSKCVKGDLPGYGQLKQEPDGQGVLMEALVATYHGQYHVDCSGLIPEREGMPPLYQQQPKEVTITWRF